MREDEGAGIERPCESMCIQAVGPGATFRTDEGRRVCNVGGRKGGGLRDGRKKHGHSVTKGGRGGGGGDKGEVKEGLERWRDGRERRGGDTPSPDGEGDSDHCRSSRGEEARHDTS